MFKFKIQNTNFSLYFYVKQILDNVGNNDFISFTDKRSAKAVGDQVYRLCCATGENNFVFVGST